MRDELLNPATCETSTEITEHDNASHQTTTDKYDMYVDLELGLPESIIDFGPYKGMNYYQLEKWHGSYCQELMKDPELIENKPKLLEYLESQGYVYSPEKKNTDKTYYFEDYLMAASREYFVRPRIHSGSIVSYGCYTGSHVKIETSTNVSIFWLCPELMKEYYILLHNFNVLIQEERNNHRDRIVYASILFQKNNTGHDLKDCQKIFGNIQLTQFIPSRSTGYNTV